MDLIKNVLLDKEFYKAIDEVEQALQDNEIDFNSVIQSLILDKATFPTEEDARLYVREHGFRVEDVNETETSFIINQLDSSEFIAETLKTIDVANGVIAVVGVLKTDAIEGASSDVFLSLRNDESINLNDKLPHVIELAKVVNGTHVNYGKVEITKTMLESFMRNFNEGVVGVDLMIDYDHEQRGAAGWVKSVFLSLDETTMYGEVKWTPKGAQCLSDREFRYFSPEFSLNYVHPHTGVSHGPTLLGGGLVNRPFLKMDAIVAFNNKPKKEEVKMDTIALNEHNAIKADLEKKVAEFSLSEEKAKKVIEGQGDEIKKLSEKVDELVAEKKETELKAKNEKLFNEGKISKAQLDALNEGKDLYEILSLTEKLNTEPKGKVDTAEPTVQLSEADKAACKALNISEEDYIKYNS